MTRHHADHPPGGEDDEEEPQLSTVEAPLMAHAPKGSSDAIGLARILALSDGVFAIAMTILVFTLRVPLEADVGEGTAEDILLELLPRWIGFVISFALLGMFWMQHHRRFRWIRRYDDMLLWINLLWLFFIVVIPFSTELISQFPDDGTAALVYSLSLAFAGLSSALLWWYATAERRLVDEDLPQKIVNFGTFYGIVTSAMFLAAGLAAMVFGASVAKVLWFLPLPLSGVLEFYRHRQMKRMMDEHQTRAALERNHAGS